jgi:hypothetical protein
MNRKIISKTILIILSLTAAVVNGFTEPVVWKFDQIEAVSRWKGLNGVVPSFNNGVMSLPSSKPYIMLSPRHLADFPASNRYLQIKTRIPQGKGMLICYFVTDSDKKFDEKKKVFQSCRFTGEWQDVTINCGKNSHWKGNITGIRIDFSYKKAREAEISAIGFYSQLPAIWDFTKAQSIPWKWSGKTAATIKNGAMDLSSSDKYIMSKAVPVNFDAAENPELKIRLKGSSGKGSIVIYYSTAAVPKFGEKRKIYVPVKYTGQWQNITLKMTNSGEWKGKIEEIRIDFGVSQPPLKIKVAKISFEKTERSISGDTPVSVNQPINQRPSVASPKGKRSNITPSCKINENKAQLENSAIRAVFQLRPQLLLKELFCAEVAKNILVNPEKTRLFMVKTASGKTLSAADAIVSDVQKTANGFRAKLDFPKDKLQAIFSAGVSDDELHLNLKFINTGSSVQELTTVFPHLDGIALSKETHNDYYLLPQRQSGVIANRDCLWQSNYGEREAFWQMLDIFSVSRGGGLYLRCNDPDGSYKGLNLRKGDNPKGAFKRIPGGWNAVRDLKLTFREPLAPGKGIGMAFDYYRRICPSGQTLKLPEAVIGTHAGDWRHAMKRYAAWSIKTWPSRSGLSKLAKRWDICGGVGVGGPLWKDGKYRDWYLGRKRTKIDVIELISWWTLASCAPWNTPFDRLEELGHYWKAALWVDPATGKKVYAYNPGDYDGYNPQWGGLPALKAQLKKTQEAKQLAIFYMDPLLVFAGTKLAKKASELVVINDKWKYKYPSSRVPTSPPGLVCDYDHYRFCIDNPEYSQWVADTVERVCRETGVGGVRLDEYGGPGPICKSTRHKHRFGGDGRNVWLRALTENIREVRKAMDKVNPGLVLMTEFFGHDMMASKLDGCLGINLTAGKRELTPAPIDLCRFYFPHCKIFEIGRGKSDSPEDAWRYRLWNAVGVYNAPLNPRFVWRILNENNDCFARCGQSEPLVETLMPLVYANRFESPKKCIWTLLNMTGKNVNVPLLKVENAPDYHYVELLSGVEIPVINNSLRLALKPKEVAVIARLPKLLKVEKQILKCNTTAKICTVEATDKAGKTICHPVIGQKLPDKAQATLIRLLDNNGILLDAYEYSSEK